MTFISFQGESWVPGLQDNVYTCGKRGSGRVWIGVRPFVKLYIKRQDHKEMFTVKLLVYIIVEYDVFTVRDRMYSLIVRWPNLKI